MKNFLKTRTIAAILVLVLICVLPLTANGAAESKGTPAVSTGTPVDIELWYGAAVSEAGPPPADWHVLEIIKNKLNINLKLTALPANTADQDVKINAAAAANSLPDIFMVNRDPWLRMQKNGLLSPVDDMYAKMPTRTSQHYDSDSRAYTTVDGKSWGLASAGAIPKNEGLLIRKDWLDKLGMKIPVTSDDFFKVMKAFTYNDPDGNGRNDTWGYGAFIDIYPYQEGLGRRFEPLFGAFGVAGTWNMSAENPGLNVRKKEYYDALAYVRKIVDEKVIDPNWLSYKRDDFRAAWKQGRFGIMREQNSAYASESNYAPFDKNFPKGEWIVIDPPKGPKGKQSVGAFVQGFRIYAVSAKAAAAGKKDAIVRLLEWMSSEEGYYLIGWGVENVNYTFDKNGVPTVNNLSDPSKGFSKAEMQPYTQLRMMTYYNSQIELLARYPTYTAASGKTMSALTVLNDMQKRPWTPAIGSDSLPLPGTDLKRFYEQSVVEFVIGKRDLTPSTWKEWLAQFDSLGGLQWEQDGITAARANSLLK